MKPERENYRAIQMPDGWYAVQHKYDLMTGFDWHTNGARYEKEQDAITWADELFKMDIKEYERLKALGRSLPDNN